jgi:hypothetical protein
LSVVEYKTYIYTYIYMPTLGIEPT